MSVAYQGPGTSLLVLTKNLTTRYGYPKRPYEFVTGYGPGGITSHNADSRGQAHAVDIFVGPGNLTEAQGIDTAERLRVEGTKGTIYGHPDRLAYIIHRGRIAGDHTNWVWMQYHGADPHMDHIHVSSVFDYSWGALVPGNPADYNSDAPWDLWSSNVKPQAGPIKPIPTSKRKTYSNDDIHWNVEAGDTLTKIANYYGVPGKVQAIANHNGIDPNRLFVGEQIWIPGPLVWIIEAPDTIRSIAAYYGLDAGYLARRNGLAGPDATIYIGNILKIQE